MVAKRDDFPIRIKRISALRVGYHCSNPNCSQSTIGPATDPESVINTGVAAHISAAAPGGLRFDANLLAKSRKSIENAIWLCQTCAKLIDSDETRYTVKLLREWKQQAEEKSRGRQESPNSPLDFTVSPGYFEFIDYLIAYMLDMFDEHSNADVSGFLKWITEEVSDSFSEELKRIIKHLADNPTAAENILKYLRKHLKADSLHEQITLINNKLGQLASTLNIADISQKENHRLAVSARLLEIVSRNLEGVGVRVPNLNSAFKNPSEGTIGFRWRIGDKSPNMILVDFVGGVLENRISVILNSSGSLSLKVYDSLGSDLMATSKPYTSGSVLQVIVTWKNRKISFWVKGQLIARQKLRKIFNVPWALLLNGIDIEGKLSADTGQLGYMIDGELGLNLGKNGISAGARLNDVAVWDRELSSDVITRLSQLSDIEVERLKNSQ